MGFSSSKEGDALLALTEAIIKHDTEKFQTSTNELSKLFSSDVWKTQMMLKTNNLAEMLLSSDD